MIEASYNRQVRSRVLIAGFLTTTEIIMIMLFAVVSLAFLSSLPAFFCVVPGYLLYYSRFRFRKPAGADVHYFTSRLAIPRTMGPGRRAFAPPVKRKLKTP